MEEIDPLTRGPVLVWPQSWLTLNISSLLEDFVRIQRVTGVAAVVHKVSVLEERSDTLLVRPHITLCSSTGLSKPLQVGRHFVPKFFPDRSFSILNSLLSLSLPP